MGTQWIPMTRMEPRKWLLGNGEVVQEPPLEMTATGRKVRVAGTSHSVWQSEIEDLLGQAVKHIAAEKQTHVWLDATGGVQDQAQAGTGFIPAQTKGKLHLVHDPTTNSSTILWWRFKDPNTLFEALLWVKMHNTNSHNGVNSQQIQVTLTLPTRTYYGDTIGKNTVQVKAPGMQEAFNSLSQMDGQLTYKWQEFMRDNETGWPSHYLGVRNHAHTRAGVSDLLKIVRDFDEVESITVPDLGDPYNPSWRTLELYDTNVNAELINDMSEYLDGAPTIEQAAALYAQMLDTLRSVGITVQGKTPNDFMAALLAGEKATLNMQVFALAEENQSVDQDHKLSVHLPTGAFIVECTHKHVDRNQVAEKWEEALTMASLTGQEDTLLAYAREYAKGNNTRRTKEILKERQAL